MIIRCPKCNGEGEIESNKEDQEDKEWEWWLKIVRVSNGYILIYENDNGIIEKEIIQDNEDDELDSHIMLLWWIADHFGFSGSKHDRERINIAREEK